MQLPCYILFNDAYEFHFLPFIPEQTPLFLNKLIHSISVLTAQINNLQL